MISFPSSLVFLPYTLSDAWPRPPSPECCGGNGLDRGAEAIDRQNPLSYDAGAGGGCMRDLDDEDDLDGSEWPNEEPDGDEENETVACPNCRRPVYEDAERCPSCGNYLSPEDAPRRYPWWFVVGFLLSMVVLLGWIFL